MYRGYIDNGKLQVAIERCTQQSEDMFLKEVEMRSQLHHLHMVSFIGYCNDSDQTILVYEYLVKGNLSETSMERAKILFRGKRGLRSASVLRKQYNTFILILRSQ